MSYTLTSPNPRAITAARPGSRADRITVPTFALAMLISSFFYCLPLGRFHIAGFGSDFRAYDYAFPIALLFCWGQVNKALPILRDRRRFFFWARLVVIVSIFSLVFTAFYGGMQLLLPALIRAYRWTAYLLTPALIVAVAASPARQRFLLKVFYVNIALQAVLAFLQGLHIVPNLWPAYWTSVYAAGGDYPVGTLSLHHKHIGVVMMIGVALSMTYIRTSPRIPIKALYASVMVVMIMVTVFAGIRTAWMGLLVFAAAYIYVNRLRALPALIIFLAAGGIFWYAFRGHVEDPLMDKLDQRLVDRVERFGLEGVAGDRTRIYFDDLPSAVAYNPTFILTGCGFQGISAVTQSTGAHNNFLQALFELGIFGFIIFMRFLISIARTLQETARRTANKFEHAHARDTWALFMGILGTMMVGETLWAQYSMFTLTGQIMVAMALAVCPLYWAARGPDKAMQPGAAGNA